MVDSSNPEEFKTKLEAVLKDEEFFKSLLEIDSAEEVKTALAEKDIDMSIEEIQQVKDALIKISETGNSELSEDDLADVSGGCACLAIGIICSVVGLGLTVAGLTDTLVTRSGRRW